ncbi:MAG: collagen-like protein, partial [Phycisphaerales bacterium]|nr:collagen-like protein [Phycisphaerales bacterium]
MSTQITEFLEQGALEVGVRGLPGPAGTPGAAGASGPPGVGIIDLRDEGYAVDVPGVEAEEVPPTLSDAAANMAALNAAVATLRANANGESTIFAPAGVGRIQPAGGIGWRFQNLGGFTISAGGANLGQGNTPDDSSWHNVNNAADNFFVGSELFAIGFGAAAVIDLFDVASVRIAGLTIRGDGADPAAIGIRIGKLVGGLGPSTIHGVQGKIHNCDVGIDVGVVGADGGGFVASNCSEIFLEQWAFSRCPIAYLVHHNQSLNHYLAQCQFSEVGDCVWQLDGGNIVVDQPVLIDSERLITVSQGGSATGVIQVRGARIDGNAHRTKLFHADLDGELVFASFLGGTTSTGNRDAGNEARCTVGSAHFVYVCDWINLVRTDATGPAFEFTGAGRKGMMLERCRLPSSSPHFPDLKKIIGNVDATGWWWIRDCQADGTLGGSHEGKRLADVEYPRINEGASTHRFHIFDHCTSPGLMGMTAGASGAGAAVGRVAGGKQHPGVRRMQTGTTATGVAWIATEI